MRSFGVWKSFCATLLVVLFAQLGYACCMPTATWLRQGGDVDQERQDVVSFWHDGQQELIVRVAPFFKPPVVVEGVVSAADVVENPTPPALVWVITVPSKPKQYHLADPSIFDQAANKGDAIQKAITQREAAKNRAAANNSALAASDMGPYRNLEISEPVEVGPYTIVAVKALGEPALGELNEFLGSNGFPTEDYDHLKWWIDRNFTFLVIKITPPEGQKLLGQKLDLEPLQVGFKTPRIYYPGMFSARQGDFKLDMTIISSEPLKEDSFNAIARRKLNASTPWYDNIWTERKLPTILSDAAHKNEAAKDVKRWYFNSLSSFGFNPLDANGKPTISSWTEDVFFDLGGQFHADRGEDEATLGLSMETIETYPLLIPISIAVLAFCVILVLLMKRKGATSNGAE